MGFPRQEHWSGFPFPGDLPDSGIEPRSPALQSDTGRRFNLWATREGPHKREEGGKTDTETNLETKATPGKSDMAQWLWPAGGSARLFSSLLNRTRPRWRKWWRIRLPMQETWESRVRSLGREDSLEEGIAINSSILAWRILWTEEPGGLWSIGSQSRTQTTEQADTHLSYGKVPKGEVSQATSPGRLHPLLLSSQCLLLSEMPMFVCLVSHLLLFSPSFRI